MKNHFSMLHHANVGGSEPVGCRKKAILLTLMHVLWLVACLLIGCNFLFGLVLLAWLDFMLFSVSAFGDRTVLCAFGIAFFTFLIGREALENVFGYKVESFSNGTNNHAYLLLLVSLLTLVLAYRLFECIPKRKILRKTVSSVRIKRIRRISKLFFYVTVAGACLYALIMLYCVFWFGYHYTYTAEFFETINGNLILYSLSKMELFLPVALYSFLATMPSRKEYMKTLIVYCLYLILSLGSGQRSTIVLGVFVILIYMVYRNSESNDGFRLRKKYILVGALVIPGGLLFLSLFTHWRAGYSANTNLFEGICDFFYQQGYSINVLKLAYDLQDKLPSDRFFSMEFLHTGIIARIFGMEVFEGNTIEHATCGYSLAHALSYLHLGDQYLAGHGTGTAYIAELYHDGGYFGVLLGNVVLGAVLCWCGRFDGKRPFITTLKLLMIPQVLWAPRGMYTDFIGVLLRPSTCVAMIVIFGGEFILHYASCIIKKKTNGAKDVQELGEDDGK